MLLDWGKICDGIMTLKLEIKHMKILVHNFTSNQHIFPLILFKDQLKKKKYIMLNAAME